MKEPPGGGSDYCGFPPIKMPPGFSLSDLQNNIDVAKDHYQDPWVWRAALEVPVVSAIFGFVKIPLPNPATAFVLPDLWWMVGLVGPGRGWDYKERYNDPALEDFGNWHFGVIVAAMGIPLEVALCGPGGVQILQRLGDELRIWAENLGLRRDQDTGRRPWGLICGDAWSDSMQIKDGCDWYHACEGYLFRST